MLNLLFEPSAHQVIGESMPPTSEKLPLIGEHHVLLLVNAMYWGITKVLSKKVFYIEKMPIFSYFFDAIQILNSYKLININLIQLLFFV